MVFLSCPSLWLVTGMDHYFLNVSVALKILPWCSWQNSKGSASIPFGDNIATHMLEGSKMGIMPHVASPLKGIEMVT